jgi:hypothetical protein
MFKSIALVTSLLSVSAFASQDHLEDYLTIRSVEVSVETTTEKGTFVSNMEESVGSAVNLESLSGLPDAEGRFASKASAGEVIAIANQVVALGERIYELVKKGKPVLTTDSTPISVMPKNEDGSAVDIMQTEGWSIPTTRKVKMAYKNTYGMQVVTFDYTIVFAHSGQFNGSGAYITGAQIVPTQAKVSWGFNFDASMKLASLQNHGTVANPVAGVVLSLGYKVSSLMSAIESHDQYHLTGRGQFTEL